MTSAQAGRIVSVAVIIAVGVNDDGRREVLGMTVGASEAETFWSTFLKSLVRRGLRGVKLVISTDAHSDHDLDFMWLGVSQARRGWLEKSDVLNTLPLTELREALRRVGRGDPVRG